MGLGNDAEESLSVDLASGEELPEALAGDQTGEIDEFLELRGTVAAEQAADGKEPGRVRANAAGKPMDAGAEEVGFDGTGDCRSLDPEPLSDAASFPSKGELVLDAADVFDDRVGINDVVAAVCEGERTAIAADFPDLEPVLEDSYGFAFAFAVDIDQVYRTALEAGILPGGIVAADIENALSRVGLDDALEVGHAPGPPLFE